ncbi:S8 family serine peptidase [Meiothermus rufus]|uniref:S8 family serine peptidase n=1 Tax=Meiothermus rufus TaxID=604332 RepID=UPI00041FBC22|nr:S8 family serine peptidase [Meiothermus rufus]
MRLFWIALLLAMAGCASQEAWLPAPAHVVPQEVVMEGLEGSLALRVGSRVAWRLEVYSAWLTATPTQGVGPGVVRLRAAFTEEMGDQPAYTAHLRLLGDVQAEIAVVLPLVRVVGQVAEAAPSGVGAPSGLRPAEPPPPTDEVLVKYRTDLRAVVLPQGSQVVSHDRVNRLTKLRTSRPQALLERLRLDPTVAWAELNGRVQAQGEPTDQHYPLQWYLRTTGARFTYLQTYSRPITVAVVDTGVRYDHPDLAGRLWGPGEGAYDFVGDHPSDPCGDPLPGSPGDPDPTDPCDSFTSTSGSHGTHVTGIIVANADTFAPPCPTCTDSGIVGMAYNAPVKVLPLRVLGPQGAGTFEDVALAIRYAAGLPVEKAGRLLVNPQPAQVINLSLGSTLFSHAMCEAVADAVAQGVLVVAAAGNYQDRNPGAMFYPASCPGAISVAATDRNNQVTYYSQQNSEVDIAAPGGSNVQPGGGILSTTWNYIANQPNYTFYTGTSQATPQVAAALAMVLSAGAASDAGQAWNLIRSSVTDLGPPGRDDAYGHGLLNLPGAFGWSLPLGDFLVGFQGPSSRWLPVREGSFETYLIPGTYTLVVCRDDSGNRLCDSGEPRIQRQIQVRGQGTFDLGTLFVEP